MKLSLVDNAASDEGLLDERQLEECQEIEKDTGQPLDRILKHEGLRLGRARSWKSCSNATLRHSDLVSELDSIETPKRVHVNRVPAHLCAQLQPDRHREGQRQRTRSPPATRSTSTPWTISRPMLSAPSVVPVTRAAIGRSPHLINRGLSKLLDRRRRAPRRHRRR